MDTYNYIEDKSNFFQYIVNWRLKNIDLSPKEQ